MSRRSSECFEQAGAWGGSHEFKTGVYLAPSLHRESVTNYINDGFYFEERRLADPSDAGSGAIPYRQCFAEPSQLLSNDMTDRDLAFYLEDTWRPSRPGRRRRR